MDGVDLRGKREQVQAFHLKYETILTQPIATLSLPGCGIVTSPDTWTETGVVTKNVSLWYAPMLGLAVVRLSI